MTSHTEFSFLSVYVKEKRRRAIDIRLNSSPIKGRKEKAAAERPSVDKIDSPHAEQPVATIPSRVEPPTESLIF